MKASEKNTTRSFAISQAQAAEIVQSFKNAAMVFPLVRAVRQKNRLPKEGKVTFSK